MTTRQLTRLARIEQSAKLGTGRYFIVWGADVHDIQARYRDALSKQQVKESDHALGSVWPLMVEACPPSRWIEGSRAIEELSHLEMITLAAIVGVSHSTDSRSVEDQVWFAEIPTGELFRIAFADALKIGGRAT